MKTNKDIRLSHQLDVSWGEGYVTDSDIGNRLVGNIMEIIEALGLPEKQEQSFKSIVNKKIWDIISRGLYIPREEHDSVRVKYPNNEVLSRVD